MTNPCGHLSIEDIQLHALEVPYKAETGTPKQMLKSLKRVYSSSLSCLETHIRLASYQSTLTKILSRKVLSNNDIQEIRRICESLVYIIQLPHDKKTYSTALKLLSSIASSSDPVAFLLCERHISPVLGRALETSTDIPRQKAAALIQLLDHVHFRHRLSETRHKLSNAMQGLYPSAEDISAVEEGCRQLIELVRSASKGEVWVRMMVQDLLYLVAKQPGVSFVLLESDIYPYVAKIATSNLQARSSGKFPRLLQRLVAENDPEIVSLRKVLYPILAKVSIEDVNRPELRKICHRLLHLVQTGHPYERTACVSLLETIAQTSNASPDSFQVAWVLTEVDFYEMVEKMWAMGPKLSVSVDRLYALVKRALTYRLASARIIIKSQPKFARTSDSTMLTNHEEASSANLESTITLPIDQHNFLLATFRDLLSVCNSPDVYDEESVNAAIAVLLEALEAHESISLLLLDPTLLPLYEVLADIHLIPTGRTSTPNARRLYDGIKRLGTRKGFKEAKNLIGRLKHTRNWSGLDSENIRPLCETLVTYATDPNLSQFRDSALESLIDLTNSPPPCATVLLEPQFAKRIRGISVPALPESVPPSSKTIPALMMDERPKALELANRMSVLALQQELRDNIPQLLVLSDHPSSFRHKKMDTEEYRATIDNLLFLYRQKEQDSTIFRIIVKSFLIIATGNDMGLDFLLSSGSDVIFFLREATSSSSSTPLNPNSEAVFDALHDLIRHLEIEADQLLQRSPPLRSSMDRSRYKDTFENERELAHAQALCWRLINICRLDLVERFTSSAVELLGSLVKSSETVYTLFLIDLKLRDALGSLGEQNEALSSSVGRILSLLDND
ncbi:hypothetical protein FRC17_003693 [Serendipita sp. 399]|nr:hypothetical protein FRC17_003693 [Serendipita sp. 399]